jgi:Uma2 family endonuclease
MSIASKVAIPEAKPAFELIDERLVQKVSPRYSHARLQGVLHGLLSAWAESRGRVGSEWRFYLDLPETARNSLVPDVAYLSYDRLSRDDLEAAQEPHVAPDVAVEIISPSDWRGHVDRKTALYLAAGTAVVMEVDPEQRTVVLHDSHRRSTYREGDILEHAALPGFRLDVTQLFASIV